MKKLLIILSVLLFSCDSSSEDQLTPEEIQIRMGEINEEMEDLIVTSCQSDAQCFAVTFGSKACGGPAKYLIYSDATDQDQLLGLVDEYNVLNATYNNLVNPVSDCGLVSKPEVGCVSGNCVAVTR